jgi:hypothetical protein
MKINLPDSSGKAIPFKLVTEPLKTKTPKTPFNRVAFAAAHVVADPIKGGIDWKGTLAYRRHLLGLGFGIAEAMDTSQRGMGLDWPTALELIKRSLKDAGDKSSLIYSGCGTDHLDPADAKSLYDVTKAYETQLHAIQKLGGRIIMMASRALVKVAKSPDDYVKVYGRILSQADHPVVLHWLGPMFDPALKGYWGTEEFAPGMETALAMIKDNVSKVDGIKISLLDAKKEVTMRLRLPDGIKMYTGDDFNYAELIAGDKKGYSHALLGIFDAIGPAASLALSALAKGNIDKFHKLLEPTVPLSRLIFSAPTQYYKTGIVFLAWLNGHQDHFVMLAGAQSARPLSYFVGIFKLAEKAGLLAKPDLAVKRMKQLLAVYGL